MLKDTEGRLVTFDPREENRILSLILRDRSFLVKVQHLLKPEYFRPEIRPIVKTFLYYYRKKKIVLDRRALADAARVNQSEINKFYKDKLKTLSVEYYTMAVEDFCRMYELEAQCLEVANLIDRRASGDKAIRFVGLDKRFKTILESGVQNLDTTSYFSNIGSRMQEMKDSVRKKIRTGLPNVDKCLKGGIGLGELGIILGFTSTGKTQLMINFGYAAVYHGKHVVHITLEMGKSEVEWRYDARVCKMTQEEMRSDPKKARRIIQKLGEINKGKLFVEDFNRRRPGIPELTSYLRSHTEKHGVPDMVLVDYADLLKPSDTYARSDQKRFGITEIYTDMRFLGGELNTRIWTISQGNRQSGVVDVVDLDNMAEAIDKAQICDIVTAICQTKQEKQRGILRLHLAKVRGGVSGHIIKCKYDFTRSIVVEG